MKSLIKLLAIATILSGSIFFNSCKEDDKIPPKIYFTEAQDTTVLLLTKFEDPGVYVEDNKDILADIKQDNDFEDAISLNADGELRRTGIFEIKYEAEDIAGNKAEEIRTVNVFNITEPLAKTYDVDAAYEYQPNTEFTASVSTSSKHAGGIRFSKSYLFEDESGNKTYLRSIEGYVLSDIYSEDFTTTSFDPETDYYGWMVNPNSPDNSDKPFYYDMTYDVAVTYLHRYQFIDIPNKVYNDSFGDVGFYVRGRIDPETNYPESKIEYDMDGNVKKITVAINITRVGEVNPDRITEVYIPR